MARKKGKCRQCRRNRAVNHKGLCCKCRREKKARKLLKTLKRAMRKVEKFTQECD